MNQEVKPKEYKCPSCNKIFKHQPSLSRHVNGNPRLNIKPCSATVNASNTIDAKYVKKLEDTIKILQDKINVLESKLKEGNKKEPSKPTIVAYKYSEKPNVTQYPLPFLTKTQLIDIITKTSPVNLPAKLFYKFHLNKDHKDYWSVLVKNKSHLREIHYWDGDNWKAERMADFFENFLSQIRVMFDDLVFDHDELIEKYDMFIQELDFEEFEDSLMYSQLKKLITNDQILRDLRTYHGFKVG